jgi:hypothetical protein
MVEGGIIIVIKPPGKGEMIRMANRRIGHWFFLTGLL